MTIADVCVRWHDMAAFLLGGDNGGRNVKMFVICTSNVYYVILESFVRFMFSQWVEVRAPDSLGCKRLKRFCEGFIRKAGQKYQVVINTYINTIRFFLRVFLCCEITVSSFGILTQQIFNPLDLVLSSLLLIRP